MSKCICSCHVIESLLNKFMHGAIQFNYEFFGVAVEVNDISENRMLSPEFIT